MGKVFDVTFVFFIVEELQARIKKNHDMVIIVRGNG